MTKLYAVRGATTIDCDTQDAIRAAALELITSMTAENRIVSGEAVSLIATSTPDIRSAYPVRFIRESGLLGNTPVFSAQEPDIAGGLGLCIRLLLHIQKDDPAFQPRHVYLRKAKILRQDIE